MKRTTESRNRREGRYAGRRARFTIEFHRYDWNRFPRTRHFRSHWESDQLRFRGDDVSTVAPYGHQFDSWSCA